MVVVAGCRGLRVVTFGVGRWESVSISGQRREEVRHGLNTVAGCGLVCFRFYFGLLVAFVVSGSTNTGFLFLSTLFWVFFFSKNVLGFSELEFRFLGDEIVSSR